MREYLKRRMRWLNPVIAAMLAVFVLIQLRSWPGFPEVFYRFPWDRQSKAMFWLIDVPLWVAALWLMFRLKCPRCGERLARVATEFAGKGKGVPSCPHCGVSFDEPYKAPGPIS